jgi:hypothetical protein
VLAVTIAVQLDLLDFLFTAKDFKSVEELEESIGAAKESFNLIQKTRKSIPRLQKVVNDGIGATELSKKTYETAKTQLEQAVKEVENGEAVFRHTVTNWKDMKRTPKPDYTFMEEELLATFDVARDTLSDV